MLFMVEEVFDEILVHVDGVEKGCCQIAGKQLLISRARKNDFMNALTDYMAGL